MDVTAWGTTVHDEPSYNTVHLGYAKFIKQHEMKSSRRENDAIKRCGKHEMYEVAAGVTWLLFCSKLLFVSR